METETLAWLYLRQGHPAKAAGIFERLLAEHPGRAPLIQGLAQSRAQLGARGSGMNQNKRLEVLRLLLARLTGEVSQLPAEAPEPPPPLAAIPPTPPVAPRALGPRERRLEVLRGLLQRLERWMTSAQPAG